MLAAYFSAIRRLDADVVKSREIVKARQLLKAVHDSLGGVFDDKVYTANAHLQLHLADQVERCGPLWATSAYSFEGHLSSVTKLPSGVRGFTDQVARKFLQKKGVLPSGRPKVVKYHCLFFYITYLTFVL